MTPAPFFIGEPRTLDMIIMHRTALLQNKLKTQLFISKITALSPYNDHKSLKAKTCSANT